MKTKYLYLLASLMLCGCTLSDPLKHGEKCPDATHINYTKSDKCADRECPEYDEAMNAGFCPQNYRCVNSTEGDYCQMDCDANSGQILCDGKCIDPDNSIEHCGAAGKCESINPDSQDYIGKNCQDMNDSDHRYYCLDRKCELNECEPGYHSYIKEDGTKDCEPDSNNACGSTTTKCELNELCIAGRCVRDCGSSEQVLCEQQCVKPSSDVNYCGAEVDSNGNCSYQKCKANEFCDNGHCELKECDSAETPNICGDAGSRICVNFETDPDHCGGCGIKCSEQVKPHAALVSGSEQCVEGKCQFVCQDEGNDHYENCGSEGQLLCVNKKKDPNHCGTCGHVCEGDNSFCLNGECSASKCDANQCTVTNCVNSNIACGSKCLNCNDVMHGKTTSCSDDGKCKVTECFTGYHLAGAEGNFTCEPNTNTSCGLFNKANASDCTKMENSTAGTCNVNEGKCELTCKPTHHLYDNGEKVVCEANSTTHCLEHGKECTLPSYAKTMRCNDTAGCVVDECNAGYHIATDDKSCVINSDSSCGSSQSNRTSNCNSAHSGWASGKCNKELGTCSLQSCNSEYSDLRNVQLNLCIPVCYIVRKNNTEYCCKTSANAAQCRNSNACNFCFAMPLEFDTWSRCVHDSMASSLYKTEYDQIECQKSLCDEMEESGMSFIVQHLTNCRVTSFFQKHMMLSTY